jgi:flagellar basal-body rod modification protein FlgD
MVSPVGVGSPASLTKALGGDKSLDKNAFLKLLVAQLKNQDPLQPQENSEFVAQLAQFTSVEQTMGINDRLDALSAQSAGLQNSELTNMVGKRVAVRGNAVTLGSNGEPTQLNYTLGGAAESVKISISDASGKVLRVLDGKQTSAGGAQRILWDGKNKDGLAQPAGRYNIAIEAKGPKGKIVTVDQQTVGTVQAVKFDKGFPELSLDNGLAVPVADLLRVESPKTP